MGGGRGSSAAPWSGSGRPNAPARFGAGGKASFQALRVISNGDTFELVQTAQFGPECASARGIQQESASVSFGKLLCNTAPYRGKVYYKAQLAFGANGKSILQTLYSQ